MKKFLLILLIAKVLFAQSDTTKIYHSGFETTTDNWKRLTGSGSSPTRYTTQYSITPREASYMGGWSSSPTSRFVVTKKLNLKSGRTYHFTFKLNRVSGAVADTIGIANDTSSAFTYLSGTTAVVVAASPTGMDNTTWRTVSFTQTPTTNGGYLFYVQGAFSEVYYDSIYVRGDTLTKSLTILSPKDLSLASRDQDITFHYHTQNIDSVAFFYGDSLMAVVAHDSSWTWKKEDIANIKPIIKDTIKIHVSEYKKSYYVIQKTLPTHRTKINIVSPMTGSGTYLDPYVLYSADQIKALNQMMKSHYYMDDYAPFIALGNDINFQNTGFLPDSNFLRISGLDGRGHTIKNYLISVDSTYSFHPVGYVQQTPGVIKTFYANPNSYSIFREVSTSVAGAYEPGPNGKFLYWESHVIKNVTIDSCRILIHNPSSSEIITTYVAFLAGQVMAVDSVTIQNCQISIQWKHRRGTLYVGSAYGVVMSQGNQLNSISYLWSKNNTITVSIDSLSSFVTTKHYNFSAIVGGLGGYSASISNSYFDGTINATLNYHQVGGANLYVGGLNGLGDLRNFSRCYTQGKMNLTGNILSGLFTYDYTSFIHKPYQLYSISKITSDSIVFVFTSDSTYSSYFNSDSLLTTKTNILPSPGHSNNGRTTTQMKLNSTYLTWDFYKAGGWRMYSSKNNGYPTLEIDTIYKTIYANVGIKDSTRLIFSSSNTAASPAMIHVLSYTPTKIKSGNNNVCITFQSSGVDSVKIFVRYNGGSWLYLNKGNIIRTQLMDTTQICFTFNPSFYGNVDFKIQENRDTTVYGLQLTKITELLVAETPQCTAWWNQPGGSVEYTDYSCGWTPGYYLRKILSKTFSIYTLSGIDVIHVDTTGYDAATDVGPFGDAFLISPALREYEGAYIKKGRSYSYTYNSASKTGTIFMTDLLNNVTYPVYVFSNPFNHFTMTQMDFMTTVDEKGFILFNSSMILHSAPTGQSDKHGTPYYSFTYTYSDNPWGMAFRFLPAPVSGQLASDTINILAAFQGSFTRYIFRGIYPKAIISVIPKVGQ